MLVVIVATHILFLEIFFRNGTQRVRPPDGDAERAELFFFDLPIPAEQVPVTGIEPVPSRQVRSPDVSNAITPLEEDLPATSIDWFGDAERIAREGLQEKPQSRAFGEQPESPYNKRPAHKPGYVWQPEEQRAGFAGPLPYVRLGKRCILIPPFFGCTLGKLPKAGGATLEEMRDPDRPRSSVPDP